MKHCCFTIQNPLDQNWYADPEARYYEGKYWIYVTHSLPFDDQHNHTVFSSSDLTHWEKHENIIDMSGFPWVRRAVWAPTIIEKNGLYYYIFASNDIHAAEDMGGLEIAVSEHPGGPFRALLTHPLIGDFYNGAQPIDAHLFKDDDGTVYLYYGGWGHCNICRMSDDMTSVVPHDDGTLYREITPPDYVEGPCMCKRNGVYHFMWSSGGWGDGSYRVVTAKASSPYGPFDNCHVILSTGDSTIANGPGHNGFLYVEDQDLYLNVYHRHITADENHPEYNDGNARFLCIDAMQFDENDDIKPITMTNTWKYENGMITVMDS